MSIFEQYATNETFTVINPLDVMNSVYAGLIRVNNTSTIAETYEESAKIIQSLGTYLYLLENQSEAKGSLLELYNIHKENFIKEGTLLFLAEENLSVSKQRINFLSARLLSEADSALEYILLLFLVLRESLLLTDISAKDIH